jgi:hypothetical protein
LVDGRNRYRALVELGIEPKFETKHFENDADLTRYLINANFNRRNLATVQRAFLAARLQEILRPQALENATRGGPAKNGGGDTRDVAAAQFGVGHTYVDTARKAIEADPKIEALVKDGTITSMHEVTLRLKDAPGAITYEEIKGLDENRNKRRHPLPDGQAPATNPVAPQPPTVASTAPDAQLPVEPVEEDLDEDLDREIDARFLDAQIDEMFLDAADLCCRLARLFPVPNKGPWVREHLLEVHGFDRESVEKAIDFFMTLRQIGDDLKWFAPVAS